MEAPSRHEVMERRTGRSLNVEFPIRRCYQGHREIAAAVELLTPRKRPIKLATAQSRISPDVRDNGREVRRLMHEARSAGAALIHLPEAAVSGCSKAHIQDWVRFDWD